LQAVAYGKPLVLLPIVTAARFQEAALFGLRDGDIAGPADLKGRRVGVRAYSQTTGLWLRGRLAEDFGIKPADIRWTAFEGAHVQEYADPPFVRRATPRQDMVGMLKAGELDAVVFGADPPVDPDLRNVCADPAAAGWAFFVKHGFVPINHVVVARREHAKNHAAELAEFVRLFARSKALGGGIDPYPVGRAAMAPALVMAARLAVEQGLTPRESALEEIWADSPNFEFSST